MMKRIRDTGAGSSAIPARLVMPRWVLRPSAQYRNAHSRRPDMKDRIKSTIKAVTEAVKRIASPMFGGRSR